MARRTSPLGEEVKSVVEVRPTHLTRNERAEKALC